ncbi:MAG TPA: histidine--tRNA ligase [Candidatus Acidoferrales bacterium]|nr:histidine--tRNA ligase [Candidatus Acidoferrales bacterium]
MRVTRVKGFADVLPGEIETWQFVEEQARRVFASYNFSEIRIPILEKTELFRRSIGETTDIVEKEMYTFVDHDPEGVSVTLRPEGTAGVVRAYVESGMYQVEPVRKLFYIGPMFRRERPQKGRLRQFYQIGAELLGRADPLADVEVLLLLADFFQAVRLNEVQLELNSLGCVRCRPAYRASLLEYLRAHQDELCENCRRRMERNPLRVLDCKEPSCAKVASEAPSILAFLCGECEAHFTAVQRLLGDSGVGYRLAPRLVRGLDYYCRTAFEWTSGALGAQNAVAAGGRYDGLVEDLGGPPTPGVGFALGLERLALLLGKRDGGENRRPDLYVVWLGEAARDWAVPVVHRLRRAGLVVEMEGEERSLKSQMRRADKFRAVNVVIIGEEELKRQAVVLRRMDGGEQSEIGLGQLESFMRERVAKS